ncbi:MAG: AAA family ATPase [Gammaproteobacteria bacterium]
MYLKHFNLSERPFSITPDPRFLYMSDRHREALAHLLYGLGEGGGFVQLTGEVGTGKTTICRCLLEQVPENVDVALVLNPKVTAEELIATVCDELGVAYPAPIHSIKTLTDVLNRHLLEAYARGRRTVLIIDEAQNLSSDVLEQVRLLTNLETPTRKLLQIILIGQPELRALLARPEMRQLAQRVTARYHLEPIAQQEVSGYIQHRLQICGASHIVFNKRTVDLIRRLSGGVPRLINVLCDRSLLGAYVEGKSQVDRQIVKKAAREVLAEDAELPDMRRWVVPALAGLAGALLVAVVLYYHPWQGVEIRAALFDDRAASTPVPATPPAPGRERAAIPGDLPVPSVVNVMAAGKNDSAPLMPVTQDGISLGSLLAAADTSYYRSAWKALLAQWSIVLPDEIKPDFCNFVYSNGMRCSFDTGTWANLRFYDRPVILKLDTADGQRVPVVLRHMDDAIAELVVGDQIYRAPIEQIDPYWHGDYILLLQAPPNGSMNMRAGFSGPDVGWLRDQIGHIQGVDLASPSPLYFDDVLSQHVLDFQRSNGLAPDGIVGKNTLIRLNSQSGNSGVPRLARTPS